MQLSKRALMIYISDAIDDSNQIEIDEEETEEFVDYYLNECATLLPKENERTSNNKSPRLDMPGKPKKTKTDD